MKFRIMILSYIIPLLFLACGEETAKPNIPLPEPEPPREYTFESSPSWADEFDYEGLPDDTKWSYDVGNGDNGWGNNELQYYTEKRLENVRVTDGILTITAIKEEMEGQDYTSTRLVSRGKGDFCTAA